MILSLNKNIFLSFLFLSFSSLVAIPNDIIIIAGTSSAGKTTTTQLLRSQIKDALSNGRDEIMSQVPTPKFDISDPNQYDLDVDNYYTGKLAEWVNAQKDCTVILDVLTPHLVNSQLDKTEKAPFRILLYVPITQYLERIRQRNKKALESQKMEELRDPLDMVFQYAEVFKVTEADEAQLGMPVSRQSLEGLFNQFSQETVSVLSAVSAQDFADEIEDEEGRQAAIQKTLSKLFPGALDSGYLTPIEPYDLIIDTLDVEPGEAVEMILSKLSIR